MLAAIDDVISRDKRKDWAALRQAVLGDQSLIEKVLPVCQARIGDPHVQRYYFGRFMPNDSFPEWEEVLSSAVHLQRIVSLVVLLRLSMLHIVCLLTLIMF